MTEVTNERRPYTVEYYKDGKKHKIRRLPPPKLHSMMPNDVVTINRKKNDDWDAGKTVTVKAVQARQPNTLTIQDGDGNYTFVDYQDLNFNGRVSGDAIGDEEFVRASDPIGSKYLLWP